MILSGGETRYRTSELIRRDAQLSFAPVLSLGFKTRRPAFAGAVSIICRSPLTCSIRPELDARRSRGPRRRRAFAALAFKT